MNNWKKPYKIVQKKKRKQLLWKQTPKQVPFKRKEKLLANLLTTINRPIIIVLVSLMAAIIFIPSLIVFPYSDQLDETNPVTVNTDTVEKIEDDVVSVAVLRTESEKIENVPLETYVARVVASEMPAEFEHEALKAQSLAARTYVINYMLQKENEESLNITDREQHQVYKNDTELREQWGEDYQWKMDKIMQAVNETKGEVLTYEGELITPVYFSTSNGYTENSEEYWQTEIPYLRSVNSPWDERSPKYKEQVTFSLTDIKTALNIDLQPGVMHTLEMTKTTGNRVKHLTVNGTSFTGRDIREKLNLPSSDFSIEQKGDYFIFTTRGYGHGVGMSQYGANGMAEEGKTYEEIIAHYYKGVTIDEIDDMSRMFVFNE
ncbi:MAG TPA: stage II sporulation protein D [Bacillota bacterium]|nr:stage II sporulation protein D [Bacillota bacterium]